MLATDYANAEQNSTLNLSLLTFSGVNPAKQTPAVVARLTGVAKNQLQLETREALTQGAVVQAVGQVYVDNRSLGVEGQFHVMDCQQLPSGRFAVCLAFHEVGSGNISSVNLLALLRLVTAGKKSSSSPPEGASSSEDAGSSVKGVLMIRRGQLFPNSMQASTAAGTAQGLSIS